MTLEEIAQDLVDACRSQGEDAMIDRLYAPEIVSVEAADFSGNGRETAGLAGLKGKHAWWAENFEVHGGDVHGPFTHGEDRFAVIFEIDATHKASGQRSQMKEIAVYHVSDGKIVREEFFGKE